MGGECKLESTTACTLVASKLNVNHRHAVVYSSRMVAVDAVGT